MPEEKIIIRFDKEGDEDLIAAIEKLDKVTKNLIRTQGELHAKYTALNPKILQLGANLKKHGKTLDDIGISTKLYNQALRGNKHAVSIVTAAAQKYETTLKGVNKVTLLGARNNRILGGSFAVLRSKILIASFALMLIKKTVGDLMKVHDEQLQLEFQIAQAIKTTGFAAGVTAGEVKRYANTLQSLTAISNTTIMNAQAILLTFTQISRDAFPRATRIALDLSVAFGQDLKQSVIQVGKALNDPILGLSALRRIGVSFNETQKEMVKGFMEVNDLASAQRVIFDELEKEIGGVSEAMAKTPLMQWKKSWNDIIDVMKEVGEGIGILTIPIQKMFTTALIPLQAYIKLLERLSGKEGVVQLKERTEALTLGMQSFEETLESLPKGRQLGFRELHSELIQAAAGALKSDMHWGIFIDRLSKARAALAKTTDRVKQDHEARDALIETQKKGAAALQKQLDLLNATSDVEKMLIELEHKASKEEKEIIKLIVAKIKATKDEQEQLKLNQKIADILFKAEIKTRKELNEEIAQIEKEKATIADILFKESERVRKKAAKEITETIREQLKIEDILFRESERVRRKVAREIVQVKREQLAIEDMLFRESQRIRRMAAKEIKKRIKLEERLADILFKSGQITRGKAAEEIDQQTTLIALMKEQESILGGLSSLLGGLGGQIDVSAFVKAGEAMKAFGAEGTFENEKAMLEAQLEAKGSFYEQMGEMTTQFISQELEKKENAIRAEGQRELEQLRNSRKYKRWSDAKKQKEEDKIAAATNKKLRANFNNQQNLAYAQIAIDTSRAVMGIWADVPKADLGISAAALTAMVITLGAAQAALVGQQSAPTFAGGGDFIVPAGYPNDTFPMRVESGERVQITPKSEVGGASPSSSTININFSGNVLSQDFIENEAIPQIKEAVRRGADLGIA